MNALNAAQRMQMIEKFEALTMNEYEALNSEIEQLRQRVAELEERRCEVCGYAEHHREHTGCLRVQVKELTAERDALKQQRDELLAAAEAIEINAEECLDFDECTAMLMPIDTYHKLMEAIASVKDKQNAAK